MSKCVRLSNQTSDLLDKVIKILENRADWDENGIPITNPIRSDLLKYLIHQEFQRLEDYYGELLDEII
ncbi:hypothetical protein [Neobacillus vireti]|uniref:hypothetical protein n=1 Tax=Neobacillus vireti TaxID=220686 RepID=UPI002FFF7129